MDGFIYIMHNSALGNRIKKKVFRDPKSFRELFEKKIIQPWNFKLVDFDKYHFIKIEIIQNKDEFFVGEAISVIQYLLK